MLDLLEDLRGALRVAREHQIAHQSSLLFPSVHLEARQDKEISAERPPLHIRLLQRVEAQPPVVARVRITGGKEGRETFTQRVRAVRGAALLQIRSEEHTSELQSRQYLVCRLLLEKKTKSIQRTPTSP